MTLDIECLPVLPSLDLDHTRLFYTESLGFGVVYASPTRLIVRRATLEIHFWHTDRKEFCENASCYMRGGGIEDLFEEFSRKGVGGLSAFELRPWNMKEFYIHDPHGNLLTFGRVP
ncbi:hypothetical protein GCM10011316_34820 [Roseibium aquae]|uniref:Uncharacterized protein n=1 Tax=Roseibium aquae TaxID=1323746 RepID=A0A916TM88_9HYPH|nr:VOC family protein [Roseibium aquae]GGB59802.1 hypothetical protein GCM10011316_34820 [Roseibium aquae]